MTRDAQCPKCNAALPRKGRFCLECGLDLYAEGVRQPPSPWPLILVGVALAAAGVAYLVTRPAARDAPELQEVQALTQELLQLAADRKYEDIVRRFFEPDTKQFQKTGDALRDIVREKGAQGLLFFRASCHDDPKEAENLVRKYGTEHPQYILGLLGALAFQDGALRTFAGGTAYGSQRTEAFLAWYTRLAFERVDAKDAQIADLGWQGQDAPDILVAKVTYTQPPKAVPGLPDPTVLPWRRLSDGRWALAFGESEHHFDELLDFLQRLKP
jgi:hypothetical protein